MNPTPAMSVPPTARRRGVSLVEMLIALAISAVLLTATMVAINASFKAYADAAEMASSQAATRMVVSRLLTYIRTGTAHGPLMPSASATPPVTLSGNQISSNFLELIDPNGNLIRVEFRADAQELWLTTTPPNATVGQSQPLMAGVTNAAFTLQRRRTDQGLWVLDRATVDLTVMPGADATLALENGPPTPIRAIASTMPRKLD